MILDDIIDWNKQRGNIRGDYNHQLECTLLEEEIKELRWATAKVDRLDALLDIHFVVIGSLHKLGLTLPQILESMKAVYNANNKKPAIKNAIGKLTKPIDYVGPESKLQKILDEGDD